jgi:ABC-2 type transport system ATP-binding protein
MLAIEANRLSRTFSARGPRGARRTIRAVHDITLAVERGERLAYIGPNGAGKSTSIKMLTGILHPSTGEARVLGLVPWRQRRELAARIGTLFGQRSQLWFELPAREGFRLLASIYRVEPEVARRRVDELAELLGARELFDRPVKSLSLGQRMRCELAASVLHSPEVLFLDEPTIGLDLIAKQRFRELLVRLNEEDGTTVLLTSHDTSDIEQVARRAVVINHGRIIFDDKVSQLRRSALKTKLLEVRFEEGPERVEVEGAEVLKASGAGYKLVVDTDVRPVREVLDDLLDRYEVADISVTDPPLEQVISKIYEAKP